MSKSLCCLAFDSINTRLHPNLKPHSLSLFDDLVKNTYRYPPQAPLFITWDKNGQLRGCIGTFQELPVESGVSKFAINAAFGDLRFPKVSANELPSLEVSVTLLDNFERITSSKLWVVGKHGLKVYFDLDGDQFSGTFLPSVAEEQGWDQTTTLWYLLRKAGHDGVSKSQTVAFYDKGIREGWLELTRYEGKKDSLTYAEYERILSSSSNA